ncbi:MAG TPA: SdiA-regulated domain-containing protein [Chitinophagales bacterium]|nr:SdiA-regulated domain-containing protein [Chitinophagales bacterium]
MIRVSLLLVCAACLLAATPRETLRHVKRSKLSVPEPSDIVIRGNEIFIASDRGVLFKLDSNFGIVQRSKWSGVDFEALTFAGNELIVADERTRQLHYIDPANLDVQRITELQYHGGANQGIEGMAYDPVSKSLYICIEKSPCTIAKIDAHGAVEWIPVKGLSDISGAAWYNNELYLLSDEDHCIALFDLTKNSVSKRWVISVNNPEGLAFDNAGNVWVISDDEQAVYKFNPLPL